MVRIHPGQPNKQKRPIERSAFSVCLGVCPDASRPDPTPCAARCGRQPSPATSPRLTARALVLQGPVSPERGRPADTPPMPGRESSRTALGTTAPMKQRRAQQCRRKHRHPSLHPPDNQAICGDETHPPETTKARPKPGFCVPPRGIPKDPTPGAMDQRLENWVARRALCRPTFLRSTSRASRVMKPALRSSDFRVSSYSISARAMPRRIAPA